MDRRELIEEFKKSVLIKVEMRDDLPQEVSDIIERNFDNMLEIYKNNNCDYCSVQEYIDGTKNAVKSRLHSIGEERKNEQLNGTNYVVNSIQRELEEEGKENSQKHKNEISEIDINDDKSLGHIVDTVSEALREVQSKQNYNLSNRGYDDRRIEQINEDVRKHIYNFEMRDAEEIEACLKNDKQELIELITEEYEEYIVEAEKSDREGKDEEENFKSRLNADISLEDQNEYVKKFLDREETEKETEKDEGKTLPGDLII